jgi:hypothetical protein
VYGDQVGSNEQANRFERYRLRVLVGALSARCCSATPETGMNGDMNLHTLGSGGAGQGLAATSAPIAKIACAASTMLVPSAVLGHAGQPWADAPLARAVRAG